MSGQIIFAVLVLVVMVLMSDVYAPGFPDLFSDKEPPDAGPQMGE